MSVNLLGQQIIIVYSKRSPHLQSLDLLFLTYVYMCLYVGMRA